MIKKRIKLLFSLTVITILASCCSSAPDYQQSNEYVSTNDKISKDAIDVSANQLGQKLALYILDHSDAPSDIRCKAVPKGVSTNDINQDRELCMLVITTDDMESVKKTIVFVKAKSGDIKVLTNFIDDESSLLSDFELSENGKYLYLMLTDEGHPFFVFFDTQKFINNGTDAQVGEVFEEYFLDHIESFYDNGDFVYALREGTITGCLDGEVEIEPINAKGEQVKRCLFHHNIFDQYSSFSSNEPFIPTRSKRRIQMPYVCNAFHRVM